MGRRQGPRAMEEQGEGQGVEQGREDSAPDPPTVAT